ncbi:MAG: LptA/OstA family protein [Chthoniobacterales bacterium]|nr:LptA/OstA family protein [Chthoniobacterales bacterium]
MNPEQPEKKKTLLPELIPTKRPQNSQTTITANNSASFDNRSGIAEFSGNVQISDPQFELSCEKLRAILREDRKGLQRVEAIGNVVIRHHSKDESGKDVLSTAKAGKAIYHVETGDLELIEWPQITQGINSHVANEPQTKMLLNRAGRIITTGSSKTVIADTGNAKP